MRQSIAVGFKTKTSPIFLINVTIATAWFSSVTEFAWVAYRNLENLEISSHRNIPDWIRSVKSILKTKTEEQEQSKKGRKKKQENNDEEEEEERKKENICKKKKKMMTNRNQFCSL